MPKRSEGNESGIVPDEMRMDFRCKQIERIRQEICKKFDELIRAAGSKQERRALKKQCDAEIAEQTSVLRREAEDDTPECI